MRFTPSAFDLALARRWWRNQQHKQPSDFEDFGGRGEPYNMIKHYIAEIVVEHYTLGVPYRDMEERGIAGLDVEGRDFDLPDGRRGQVRWNNYRPFKGKLYHHPDLPFTADVLVLVVPAPPLRNHDREVEVFGWTDLKTWTEEKYLDRFGPKEAGYNEVPMMDSELLDPIGTLLAELR